MEDDIETRRKKSARLKELTANEKKILGSITYRRRQKACPDTKFPNKSFKNLNSCWTPVTNRASNEQVRLTFYWIEIKVSVICIVQCDLKKCIIWKFSMNSEFLTFLCSKRILKEEEIYR